MRKNPLTDPNATIGEKVLSVLFGGVAGAGLIILIYFIQASLFLWAFMDIQELFSDYILWEPLVREQALAIAVIVPLFKGTKLKHKDHETDTVHNILAGTLSAPIAVIFAHLAFKIFVN